MVDVLFLCTGNAARSVMAGVGLATRRPELVVETAGTLVVDGQPMSWRTRAAIEGVGLAIPHHRSRQVHPPDLDGSRLIVALAPEHVAWVRRTHAPAGERTVTLRRLAAELPGLADLGTIDAQVAALDPAAHEPTEAEEVVDPGGGEADLFAACAREVDELIAVVAAGLAR